MSQSATWDALQVARDARLLGEDAACARILESEAAADVEYVRRTVQRPHPRFFLDEGDDYDDYEPASVQRQQHRAYCDAIDWLEWKSPGKASTLTSLSAIYKRVYTDRAIGELDRAIAELTLTQTGAPVYQQAVTGWTHRFEWSEK